MIQTSSNSSARQTPQDQTDPRDRFSGLFEAVARYFDMMYDCDTSEFDRIFASTSQLHGFRDGAMVCWSASAYRHVLEQRQPPESQAAPRLNEILQVDFAAPDMAFVKVRVRINNMVFIDYLTWHRIDSAWLITSKGFHVETTFD